MASNSIPLAHPTLQVKRHVAFFNRHIRLLPRAYTTADTQRMTLAFFCLSALDLLRAIADLDNTNATVTTDSSTSTSAPTTIFKRWIWTQQVTKGGGFRASPANGPHDHTTAHLAMTYTALLTLAILRDDFSQLDRTGLNAFVGSCQQRDGSFSPSPGVAECDPRFTFCAFAICWMLDDWTGIDVNRALAFLDTCRSYDGAFGQGPHQESHGGSTYCVLASYSLADRLERLQHTPKLIRWLLARQSDSEADLTTEKEDDGEEVGCEGAGLGEGLSGGFNGRIGKKKDSCYSFWCGASLAILSHWHLIQRRLNLSHLIHLQTNMGGIPKTIDDPPDLMHSYLALAALALHNSTGSESEGEKGRGEDQLCLQAPFHCQEQEQEQEQKQDPGDQGKIKDPVGRNSNHLTPNPNFKNNPSSPSPSPSPSASPSLPLAALDPRLNISLETRDWIRERLSAAGAGVGA